MEGRCLDGEAAREDARDEATMALARESTAFMGCVDVDVRRRFWFCRAARQEGL